MGIHICLEDCERNDVREWDWLRQADDRSFPSLIDWAKCTYKDEGSEYFRPTNLVELANKVNNTGWPQCSIDRYIHLLTLIEQNCGYWLHFSI